MRRKMTSSKAKQTKKSLNKQYKLRRSSIPTMHPKDPGDMYNSSRRMGNSRDPPKNGFLQNQEEGLLFEETRCLHK